MADIISSLGLVFKALRSRLNREGVNVGGTAGYPRVEIHSVTESEWLDKGTVRQVACIVECMSTERIADVMEMNEDNLRLMLAERLMLTDGWQVIGILPGQLQELTETSETNAVIYRLLQNIMIFVEKVA